MPYCTFSDHTLPITDVICGVGTFPRCRVLTSSFDHTVKLWDLLVSTHPLLTTFQFPKPISCLAWDPTERFFFAASHDDEGYVHRKNLFRQRENTKTMKAIGGTGTADLVRAADERSGLAKQLITAG